MPPKANNAVADVAPAANPTDAPGVEKRQTTVVTAIAINSNFSGVVRRVKFNSW